MPSEPKGPRKPPGGTPDADKLDRIVAQAHRSRDERQQDYREQALRLYPWICTRCGREFTRENLQELTVHHKNHDHDYNPPNGSNWELLCIYCHENEHARHVDHSSSSGISLGTASTESATHRPFEALKSLLKDSGEGG